MSVLTEPKPVHSRLDNLLSAVVLAYEGHVPSRPAQFFSPQRLRLGLLGLRVQRQLSLNSQRRRPTQFMRVLPSSSLCGGILSLLELKVKCLLCGSWGVTLGPWHLYKSVGTMISVLGVQREWDPKDRLANWSIFISELQVLWETCHKIDRQTEN